ncbi:MAG TPA: ABC transporter permease [Ktedonobacteraceae bacterium]|nr:ABC transporter permease [Ktedonobacteraceae bacterium]
MNVSSQLPAHSTRTESVVMGRQDYLSVVLRLIGIELYKLRRRVMSKALGIIAIALAVLPFALVAVGTFATANAPAGSFTSSSCQSFGSNGQPSACPTPSAAQVAQERQTIVQDTSSPLRLPASLNVAVQYGLIVGILLLVILVGTIAGGEYGTGTIRLLFIRGPTRTQFLLAKLGASLVVIFITVLVMTLLGILTGQLFNPVSGIAQAGDFWSAAWIGHALLYLLIAMLNWFMFAVIAIFFATLGRSTVAGVVAGISWLFIEPILGSVLVLLGNLSKGALGDILKAIPNYFIGTNFSALLDDQGRYLSFGSASTPGVTAVHAIIVLLVYFAFFIGLTWWINKRRDVTN